MSLTINREFALADLELFATEILKLFPKGAIVGLSGELGSGKTTLVRTIIKLINTKSRAQLERVISPSYVLHQSYENIHPPVHHFDLYRLEQVDEAMLVELEYYESVAKMKEKHGFVFVEWPEMCPKKAILELDCNITIQIVGNTRKYLLEMFRPINSIK